MYENTRPERAEDQHLKEEVFGLVLDLLGGRRELVAQVACHEDDLDFKR